MLMKICPGVWGRGVQGMLNYLLVQGMIVFTMHLASSKCTYVYNLIHPFAGNLSLQAGLYKFSSFSILNS